MVRAQAALLLCALGWACSRSPARVTSLRVSAGAHQRTLEQAGVGREALEAIGRDGLREAGFRMVGGPPGYRARLEVRSAEEAFFGADREVEVAVELRLSAEGTPGFSAVTEVGVGRAILGEDPGSAWREALTSAAREASAGLVLALSAERRPVEQLISDLRSADPRRREQAIRVLGDRRSREAVEALIERLDDPDPLLAERAAGALARIGDPRAVDPIIDFSMHLDGGRQTAHYTRIIADIGGSEARAYLLTLESGHADPEVRDAARQALADMDAREAEQARVAAEQARTRSSPPGSGRMER
jgi:hypothetical protein